MIRPLPSLLRGLGALVLLSACQLPLPDASIPLGRFFVQTSSSLGVQDGGSRTILPTVPAYHYTVDLTGTATLSFTNLTALTEPFQAPLGPYTLKVTLYNGANEVIGVSADLPVTVDANPALNQFSVTVTPLKLGSGTLQVSYTWPATAPDGTALADAGVLKLLDLENGSAVVDVSGFSSVDTATQTAGINGTIPSGTYLLSLTLSKTVGGQPRAHPTFSEVVQIYDNLVSAKTYALTASSLNGPPAAPPSFSAAYVGTAFQLSWNAYAGTQSGFRVYRNGTLVASPNVEQTTFSDASAPGAYAEVFEIAAYNDFGESVRLSQTVNFLQLVPSTTYALKAGYAETTGPSKVNLALSWTNPAADIVALHRAEKLSGPYDEIYKGSGTSFLDSEITGLIPGKTYYYAIAAAGGHFFGLPVTTIMGGVLFDTPFAHTDPVPGVISGTTMAWDSSLNIGVPILGVPYLAPDTSLLPSGTPWFGPELPVTALLAGGYTYWVWGYDTSNGSDTLIAAFDSLGVYRNSYTVSPQRQISALAMANDQFQVTGQNGTSSIPWPALDWFRPVSATVTIDFTIPTDPGIALSGTVANGGSLDGSSPSPQTMVVAPNLAGLSYIQWTLDGITTYADLSPLTIDPVNRDLTINSQYLSVGTHELMLMLTDGVHVYSANFTFTVVKSNIPS